MDSLFHFVFPLMAALAARLHVRHGLETVVGLSLATVLLDLDVFAVHRATLHNVWITLALPVVLFALALRFESPRKMYWKTVTLALALFLFSHPLADMATEGGVQLLYPLSSQEFAFGPAWTVSLPQGEGALVSGPGLALAVYFFLVLLVLFVEDFVRFLSREPAGLALRDVLRKEEKKLRREL